MASLHVTTIAGWAIGTVAALSAIAPVTLNATAAPAPVRTDEGVVKMAGAEFRLSVVPADAAGQSPSVQVDARNPGEQTATGEWSMSMLVGTPTPPMSRVASFPKEVWKQQCSVSVPPGGKRVVLFRPGQAVDKNASVRFVLRPASGQPVTLLAQR